MTTIYTAFLVDDDQDDHLLFQMATERIGAVVNCQFANDCDVAIEKLKDRQFKPDIIFIDINMPRMNGMECLAAIKKMADRKDAPVYMYTTSADQHVTQQCILLGAKDVVKKLPKIEQMRERLMTIFSNMLSSS